MQFEWHIVCTFSKPLISRQNLTQRINQRRKLLPLHPTHNRHKHPKTPQNLIAIQLNQQIHFFLPLNFIILINFQCNTSQIPKQYII